jgi:Tol biopolymer transport system component
MKPKLQQWLACTVSVILALSWLTLVIGFIQGTGSLTRITTTSPQGSNIINSRKNHFPDLSSDGTKIAFVSDVDIFNQGIVTNQYEIWLYDTAAMTLTRITTASGSNKISQLPNLNMDGTKLAFMSDSDFLSQGVTQNEIWLYDTATMAITRITTASNSNQNSAIPILNGDGTKIAFASNVDFLNQGIPSTQQEVWLYDTTTMTFTRITTASDSDRVSGSGGSVYYALSMSADSTKIVFTSDSDFLGQGLPRFQSEIWLYDTTTMTVTRITTASSGNRDSFFPSLSEDGTKIAFLSDSDFFSQGIQDNQIEVWLFDMTTLTLTRVTTDSHGNRFSFHLSLNADGTKLAFMSDSDLLGEGIPQGQAEIWLYDTLTMVLTRITNDTIDADIRASEAPSISADGAKIAFHSYADFLGQGIPEFHSEIWLYSNQVQQPYLYLPVVLKN